MQKALDRAQLKANDIDIVNAHATATPMGDIQEAKALMSIFGELPNPSINATKGFIGHCMGAAGAIELAGNLPAFDDHQVHPCLNINNLDPDCDIPGLVRDQPLQKQKIQHILNNSFGMLGINSVVIVSHYPGAKPT